jgi:hypothetical protein
MRTTTTKTKTEELNPFLKPFEMVPVTYPTNVHASTAGAKNRITSVFPLRSKEIRSKLKLDPKSIATPLIKLALKIL